MSVEAVSAVWAWRNVPMPLKMIALRLADHADPDGGNAWPSVRRLAEDCGVSERSVQRHLRALEDAGLIVSEGYSGRGTGKGTVVYRIVLQGCQIVTPTEKGVTAGVTPGVTELCHPNRPCTSSLSISSGSQPKPAVRAAEEPEGFAHWYDRYPRKEGRKFAARAFRTALKHASLQDLNAGLDRYLRFIAATNRAREYIKTPAAWLNGGHWQDEYATQAQRKPEPVWMRAR